jgi:hypothetical protein
MRLPLAAWFRVRIRVGRVFIEAAYPGLGEVPLELDSQETRRLDLEPVVPLSSPVATDR